MVDLKLRPASLTNRRAGFVMHAIHIIAGLLHTLMVGKWKRCDAPTTRSIFLSLSPHLFFLLTHHFSCDQPLIFLLFFSTSSHLFLPSFISPSFHLFDYYELVGASGSGAVYVSDGGVWSLHSLLRSAAIDFFGAYLTYSHHISLSE